jgi:hypothetical protein
MNSLNILRFAQEIVESIRSGLVQQTGIVQEQALSPLNAILQQVIGTQWIGQGADAFAEELSSIMIPDIGRVTDNIGWLNAGLGQAAELISAADKAAVAAVNEFADACSNIF